ncbi:MAG: ABC transporter permease [Anaerolineales bacterium]|jgi:NitT/TauT family transport system permease protein
MSQTPSAASSRARKPRSFLAAAEFVFPFIVVAIIWELVVRLGVVSSAVLPPPSQVLQELWQLAWEKGVLLRHLGLSLRRLAIGYALAVVVGMAAGTLMALHEKVRATFTPVLSMLMSVPTIAWVPVLLLTLGLGDRTVIMAVFLGGVFAITFNTMRGIEMVSKDHVNAGRTMGVSGLRLFFSVLLPGSLVSVITGLRLGIGYSWRALVGGEMLSALVEWGVGKMIYQARFWNDAKVMLVGLMIIGLTSFLLERFLLNWLERATVEKWGMLAER